VLLDLGGLTPTSRGVRVRYSGGKCTVTDGPFAEAKEVIAGYSLIQVKTLAEAVEWAKRAPFGVGVQSGEEAVVELRPLFDPSEFENLEVNRGHALGDDADGRKAARDVVFDGPASPS